MSWSRLKVRHLEFLRDMGRFGSLTRIAQETGISQPAVTKTLAEIEALFDATLFQRAGRGLKATEMGELAMVKARHLLQELDHWGAEMEAVRQGHRARLKVGVVPYVPATLLTQAVIDMVERHNIVIAISQSTTDVLVEALADHRLDCVVGRAWAVAGHQQLWHEVLYGQRPVLIAHQNLVKRIRGRTLDWKKLAAMQWMLPAWTTPVGAKMAELFMRAQVPVPVPIVETYSVDVMHGVLSRNEGVIAPVPEDIAVEITRRGGVAILPWRMDWELPPISLIRRVRDTPLDAEEKFLEILKELCAPFATNEKDSP